MGDADIINTLVNHRRRVKNDVALVRANVAGMRRRLRHMEEELEERVSELRRINRRIDKMRKVVRDGAR